MVELVSKEQAVNILRMYELELSRGVTHAYAKARHKMEELPSIELVKCKDCKFKRPYEEDGEVFDYCALEVKPNRNWTVEDTDFCSWGERR